VIAGNTVLSMPERLEYEVLQKARYINSLTSTFFLPFYWSKIRKFIYPPVFSAPGGDPVEIS